MNCKSKILRIRKDDCAVVSIPAGETLFVEGSISRTIERLAEETPAGRVTELTFAEDALVVLQGLELIGVGLRIHVWQATSLLFARLDRRPQERTLLDFRAKPNYELHAQVEIDGAPTLEIDGDLLRYALLYPDEELIAAGPRDNRHGQIVSHAQIIERDNDVSAPQSEDGITYTETPIDISRAA